ncbi:MAG: glycosyl hydrolase [Lachnospiraceae bacterium]|nr:glycosyl hydrolase [Lachnospiraceae bacterium]
MTKHNGEKELKFGMQPFWFWNGDMREEEIVCQILEMKEKGIPGFFIHPRQGMEIPYLSQEYFERVKLAVQTAKEQDLEVWIYDEYPYPSGICGGEVILDHPEFLCKRLKRVVKECSGGEAVRLFAPWGRVILAKAYRVTDGNISLEDSIDLTAYVGTGYQQEVFQYSGLTQYNKKRYFTGDPGKLLSWTAPEGEWKIYLVTEVVMNHFKYFENFIDTMNPEAIQYFIKLTHERYKKVVGEEFGKTIKGFFTDEITAFPDKEPWSPLLPGKVMERHGIDLISSLPALWEDMGELSSKVRYAYWNTATDCFIEGYDKAVYEWCENNHLLYVGEKPIMRSKELKYMHIPGIDAGHQKVGSAAKMVTGRYRSNGKMISSAAHFYDKPAALCEAGHSIGWGMTIQDLKWIFDWLAVQGVDFYVIHGFFFTTDGLKKHDAPPSAFFQMPWWGDASGLTSYAKRLGDFQRSIRREIKILVLDPVTSAWTSNAQEQLLLKEDFAKLQNQMLCQELDYYIIDPELFAEGTVVTENGRTEFQIHGESYEMVVLPPMRNLEAGACRKVVEFALKGGKTGAFGCIPFEKIEDSDCVSQIAPLFGLDAQDLWDSYAASGTASGVNTGMASGMHSLRKTDRQSLRETGNVFCGKDAAELIGWMKENHSGSWTVTPVDGKGREGLPSVCGIDEKGEKQLFLVNTTPEERCLEITGPDGARREIRLGALESRFIRSEAETRKDGISISLDEEMEFELENYNALRLGTWTAALPDGQEGTAETAPVIDQLEAGGFLRPVRQKRYFGCPKELEFEGTQICYRTEFDCEGILDGKEDEIYLVMEPETFLGDWTISVNGTCFEESDFVQKKLYLDTNLAVPVTGTLREGRNRIEVTVQTEVSYGGMRNPLYLFGDFQVRKEGEIWKLLPLQRKGFIDNPAESGLPFYYGEIRYIKRLEAVECDEETVVLELAAPWLSDSVRLRIGSYETAPCSWQPYRFEVPAELLKREVKLEIRLKNTAIGLFEGQLFNRERHAYEEPFR